MDCGLSEINFSTGLDHQKWVPEASVVNACESIVNSGIPVVVTIEKDTEDSNCYESFIKNKSVKTMMNKHSNFGIQCNSWMPFKKDSMIRHVELKNGLRAGCEQIFNNCVLTPKKEIAACCGLVIEHVPELRVGNINEVDSYEEQQKDDFLKLWLRVEGPMNILESLLGKKHEKLNDIVHICQACAILHKDNEIREELVKSYKAHILPVWHKWNLIKVYNADH